VRNTRATCLAAAIALALVNPLTVTEAAAQSPAQDFRVEAGSLGQALNQFATQSHLQIIYAPELVQNQTSLGLTGSFAPEDALKMLLKGAAIGVEQVNASTFVLKAAQTKTPAKPANRGEAQAAQTPKDSEQFDTIVVTGILAAQEGALSTKREANGFVDAINAEDVGKLPDMNIAEALQRVTGVAIQRTRGEGDFISIRGLGPNFVRGEIDGRTLVSATESLDPILNGEIDNSTGRETNFDLLPAEIISSIEVVKSPSASQVEGGIGGVVNIKTQRPLTLGDTTAASIDLTYRDFNGKIAPRASAVTSWVNADRTFGMLGAVAYSERDIRETSTSTYTWVPAGFADNAYKYDTNGDGKYDGQINTPWIFVPESTAEKRKRLTLQGALEWKLPDGSHLSVDAVASKRDLTSLTYDSILGICCQGNGVYNPGVTNPDGSETIHNAKIDGNTLVGYTGTSPNVLDTTNHQNSYEKLYTVGAHYSKMLGDWDMNADLSYSGATGKMDYTNATVVVAVPFQFRYFQAKDQQQYAGAPNNPAALANLSNYQTYSDAFTNRFNRDHETSVAVDLKRQLSAGFISALEFGVRYSDRVMHKEDYSGGGNNAGHNLAGADPKLFGLAPGNYMNGQNAFQFGGLLFPDYDPYVKYSHSLDSTRIQPRQFNAQASYAIDEKTTAAFAQADVDTEFAGIPIKGDAGVRLVKTETSTTGYYQPFEIVSQPVVGGGVLGVIHYLSPDITSTAIGHSYSNVLPMTNLRAEFTDDLLLRFSAGQSVTRPTFAQMAPGLAGINPTERFAQAGNPALKAYLSDNYDLGLEWYFGKGSALYAAIFHKDIHDFIGVATTLNTRFLNVDWRSLQQPLNQGDAKIDGVEAGLQQIFDSGFGYLLNTTFIDSSAVFTSGVKVGSNIPFEGVSKQIYNATVFYEKHGFGARLAWTHRSEYVRITSDVLGQTQKVAPYGQLDASVSYQIDKNWAVFANAINLTGASSLVYVNTPLEPASYAYTGKRFALGMKLKF